MIRIAIITVGFVLSVLMFAAMQWFEVEETNVENINKEHLSEIERLKKISQINKWLNRVVKPSLEALPSSETLSENSLVQFYDTYSKELNFKVARYIYNEENSHNLDIDFKITRNKKSALQKLMNLKYQSGFLKFDRFELKQDTVNGRLQLVQPFYGETNASHR